MDSNTIIDALKSNKHNGLKEIYGIYYKPLRYFVSEYIKDKSTAEDIVAETFVKLWEYREKFDSMIAIRSFLYVTAKHASLNHLRKIYVKQEFLDINNLDQEIFDDSDIFNNIVRTEIIKSIYDEVQKLPAKQQEIFRLTFIEDKSIDEICTLLQMNESAVYTNRSRAIATIKKVLTNKDALALILLHTYLKNI